MLINAASGGKISYYDAFPQYSQIQEVILGFMTTKEGAKIGRQKFLKAFGFTYDDAGKIVPQSEEEMRENALHGMQK